MNILLIKSFFILQITFLKLVNGKGLNLEFTWTRISYHSASSIKTTYVLLDEPANKDAIIFPSSLQEYPSSEDIDYLNKNYIYENNIPMGANRWKDKLFITVPRRRFGIPSTLNYININTPVKHNIPLIPYPDLKTNMLNASPGQEHLVSVYRVAVDPCDRLWIVDTGVIEAPKNRTVVGPQKLIVIDLNTDRIIKTYKFKDSDITNVTILALPTVDVTADTCEDAYVYIPDFTGVGLVVYSLKQDDSWRIRHNYFGIEADVGNLNIGGFEFHWADGVFSGALTHVLEDGYRNYIFHALAATHLHSVSTKILRNKELATRLFHGTDFKDLGNRGPGCQTSASDLHKASGALFLALVNQNAVGCWNIRSPFQQSNFGIVNQDNKTMVYPADLKIYQDDIIVLTNSMPVFVYSKLDYDKVNFRVWMNNVYEAVKGTPCEIKE